MVNNALTVEQELDLIAQNERDERLEREVARDWSYQDFLYTIAQLEQEDYEEWLQK